MSTTQADGSGAGEKGRVLVVGSLKPSLQETLTTKYEALVLPEDRAPFLAEHGPSVSAVVTTGRFGVDAALFEALPGLGAVVNFGVGYDTTDTTEAARRGVAVTNTPDVLSDCVADTAVGLVIDVLRGLSTADRFIRSGKWTQPGYPLQRKVTGRRIGILGLGRIGRAIAKRLEAFDCPISYHNRRQLDDVSYTYAASAAELAGSVDVLVVAAAGGSDSAGLVSREVLERLGPQGYLINIARGSVVDEDALVELLVDGRLAGAGLDVFAHEPHVPEALLGLDTVVLLPHLASGTVETREAMEALTLENLDAFLAGKPLPTPVALPEVSS